MTEKAGDRDLQADFHWPHAADACKAYLDLRSIEPLAVRVLARGLLSQRLVSFVGAGVSASYGRMTWPGLMEALWRHANDEYKRIGDDQRGWPQLKQQLWDGSLDKFLAYSDVPIKAQVLSEMLKLQPLTRPAADTSSMRISSERADPLQEQTKFCLENFHGFIDWLVSEWFGKRFKASEKVRADALRFERELAETQPSDGPQPAGLLGVLAALDGAASALALRRTLIRALALQSTDTDSPLRLLIDEWGIRRFLTTNYDREIERGLTAMGFTERCSGTGEVHGNQFAVLNFGRKHTGAALRFALEGPRRHAAVLHLHGDVAEPSSLIISESHYQHLYLDDHVGRDLVSNATQANFGANPVLFVGSNVAEDDVLRPLRQFMTGDGHRGDRMAVALIANSQNSEERAQRNVGLWLKYGILALDVGHADTDSSEQNSDEQDLWLVRLLRIQKANREAKTPPERAEVHRQMQSLRPPTRLEQVDLPPEDKEAFKARLSSMTQMLAALADVQAGADPLQIPRTQLSLDVTVSWMTSRFICAKLIQLRQRALLVIEDDAKLALPYESPATKNIEALATRHPVKLAHQHFHGRFEKISTAARGVFDEHIGDLCKAIRKSEQFSRLPGRRVLIVSAARGHGKGGQFDRLVTAQGGGSSNDRPYLSKLLSALNYPQTTKKSLPDDVRVLHINLTFSNEIGPVISLAIAVMDDISKAVPKAELPSNHDQAELLGRAMHALSLEGTTGRVLLILGNAGVLFDAEGRPKNGQIQRVMRTLLAPRYANAKLDILMYVGESQMPEKQRIAKPDPKREEPSPTPPPLDKEVMDMRMRRRLHRLNIEGRPPGLSETILVHPLGKTRVSELAQAYFPELSLRMGWLPEGLANKPLDKRFPERGSAADEAARRIYFATGGSRLAQTLLLSWMEAAIDRSSVIVPVFDGSTQAPGARSTLVDYACAALRSAPAASAVEACVEFVLDQWAGWHRTGNRANCSLPSPKVKKGHQAEMLVPVVQTLADKPTAASWTLATELLWHLSAFSHPVETGVLTTCPRVFQAAGVVTAQLRDRLPLVSETAVVLGMLELLTHWCLAFRVGSRPIPSPLSAGIAEGTSQSERIRYTVHRNIQRHFQRLMGGRNVEVTSWDQYTTTLYASQPDESPVLPAEVHVTLVDVVRRLSRYPEPRRAGTAAWPADVGDSSPVAMVQEADQIRAAYYLVRSTYSLGVVCHLTAEAAERVGGLGHLEQYRRLVRWITHAARYWEKRYGIGTDRSAPDAGGAWSRGRKSNGIFFPGELVWLYNESGVISLAQGKLHDAEQLLTMAEAAARLVESDDTGSLHTRIRIHSALVQIERGRPQRARRILQPIAERRGEHRVPPLLAEFYLGQLDHLGGNYAAANARYELALAGLRQAGRSRASAFALMNKADVQYSLNKLAAQGTGNTAALESALCMAEEAISLAQQGGHEDLRVMATLTRARICVDAGRIQGESLFEHLSFAQRYAVLTDMPRLSCEVHELRARLLMRQGEYKLSANDASVSLEIAAMYDLKLKKARGLLTLSEIYLCRGEVDGARSLAAMGREIAASCDYYACVRGFKELDLRLNQNGQSL
ncbi:SIR2 family protein [Paucibacter sp. R3-3]|uniref:SIR2 family protein n=1 Tax=Roseateles agri TaxID=3098619 RepID=A0ABU5DPR8_9BURK|nr:SIR2 family protein [Paucibacter sp. R3-3]MDY0748315.1 SIR2 family protein [Paucibacter sp. R3-3]